MIHVLKLLVIFALNKNYRYYEEKCYFRHNFYA